MTGVPFLPVPLLMMLSPTRALWNFDLAVCRQDRRRLAFAIEVYSRRRSPYVLTVVFACAAGLGAAPAGAVVPWVRLGASGDRGCTYWRCRASCSTHTWPISGCRFARFHSRCLHRCRSPQPCCPLGLCIRLVLILTVRVGEVEDAWAKLSAGTNRSAIGDIAAIAAPRCWSPMRTRTAATACEDYGLVHADCIAIIERSALVTTAFTVVGKQIMHARPALRSQVDTEDGTPPIVGEAGAVRRSRKAPIPAYVILAALDDGLRLSLRAVHQATTLKIPIRRI